MSLPRLPHRDDLTGREGESWRPPVFHPSHSVWTRSLAVLRRSLDLQASSIWQDLSVLLRSCRGTVVDVGCGAQPYRSLIPPEVRYIGIDTTDAQSHFGYKVPDTVYFQGTTWPLATGSIDTVIATETLEHVMQPQVFLSEAKRVLKENGWMILTVPFAARWHYIPHDYWRFTPSGLKQILESAGFAVPTVYARGNEITVASYKLSALILMLLLGHWSNLAARWTARLTGCLLLPFLIFLSIVGQMSLWTRGGNDCLGYTVVVSLSCKTGVPE